ncbi:MAG: efflux RND transporter periplasmic adaptor subunit [Paludibacter sp.]|nr:efflux RND transporter periplasmic adaptor subunit [Paludibacter sp.]
MKKKTTIWIALIFIALTIILLKIGFTKPNEKVNKERPQREVDAYIVHPSLLINDISVSGSLQAFESVELKTEVSGRVVEINLSEGEFVKKGTLLVKLFNDDLQAELNKLKSQLAIQEQIYKRQKELLTVDGITQNEYEQNGLTISALKADIEVQKAMIRKTEILAPFDGMIGLRNISVGAIVNSSTLLATIRTGNKLKLDFFVPEKYSSEIKKGMNVKFSLSNNDELYDATVFATERGIEDATRNMKVRAIVKSNSNELIAGNFVNVKLRLSENNNALMIPTQALIPQDNGTMVVVSRNSIAKFVLVKTGIRKSAAIEITEGIQKGDTIVTSGLLFVKENGKLIFSNITDSI